MDIDYTYRHDRRSNLLSWFTARRLIVLFSGLLILYAILFLGVFLYLNADGTPGKKIIPPGGAPPSRSPPPPSPLNVLSFRENSEKEIDEIIERSNFYKATGNWTLALELLDKGLAKYPWSDKLATYKGGWYYDQGNWGGAEEWYRKAHELNPNEVVYIMNVALCLANQHKEAIAIEWYQKAYDMRPSTGQLLALWSLMMKFNNWTNYDKYVTQILEDTRSQIRFGQTVSINSFVALHLPFTAEEIQGIAASAASSVMRQARSQLRTIKQFEHSPEERKKGPPRIRVGYVSYDIRQHAVGVQIQSMFGYHNRSKFEVFAYNVNDGKRDSYAGPVYDKVKAEVEHMVDLGSAPLPDALARIRDDKIDVLIDVGLYTAYARNDIFTMRPAPIQVAWLGLATTTGASWMDYVVGDPVVTPHQYAKYYTEKLAVMPHSYHIVDHKQSYGIQREPDRKARGLPENKFLFCNHANNIRLSPRLFDSWAEIVKRSPNSTLLLKFHNQDATNNLKIEAKRRGLIVSDDINESQVLFQHGIGGGEHIAVKSMCDLFLDSFHYNGHSTTADMLWAGVPLVTFPSDTMAGRAAASFITSTGVPTDKMIANSYEDYIQKAVDMAANRNGYAKDLREEMRAKRMTMPFFDTARWVKNFERAMEQMFEIFMAGKPPQHVYVIDTD